MSRPARPRTLLDFINWPILKGVAPVGTLKRVFTGKSGQNRKKFLGELCMRQKLFKTKYYIKYIFTTCNIPKLMMDTVVSETCPFSNSKVCVFFSNVFYLSLVLKYKIDHPSFSPNCPFLTRTYIESTDRIY